MNILKRIWTVTKIIMIPFIVLNIIPAIWIAIVYFKGTASKYEYGYWTPYCTGLVFDIVLIIIFIFYKLTTYDFKDF